MHPAEHEPRIVVQLSGSRMRTFAQVVGGVVLGLGLASAAGLDPGLVFAGYTTGLGILLLCLGLLLPEDPGATACRHDRPCPPPR
jgi:hypothetical protein